MRAPSRHSVIAAALRAPLLLLFAVGAVLGGAGCTKKLVEKQKVVSRKAVAAGLKIVEIRNHCGDLELVASQGMQPRVEVTATHRAKAPTAKKAEAALESIDLKLYRQGDRAILVIKHPKAKDRLKFRTELRVLIPASLAVDADTGRGKVRSLGLGGELTLRTGKGDIEARNVRTRIQANTDAGDIGVSGPVPAFSLLTKQGDITLRVRRRTALAEASSVETQDGDITLSMNRTFNGQLSVEAKDGKIRSPWSGLSKKGNVLAGQLGSGGKLLRVSAPRGSVKLLSRRYIRLRSRRVYIPGSRRHRRRKRPRPPLHRPH